MRQKTRGLWRLFTKHFQQNRDLWISLRLANLAIGHNLADPLWRWAEFNLLRGFCVSPGCAAQFLFQVSKARLQILSSPFPCVSFRLLPGGVCAFCQEHYLGVKALLLFTPSPSQVLTEWDTNAWVPFRATKWASSWLCGLENILKFCLLAWSHRKRQGEIFLLSYVMPSVPKKNPKKQKSLNSLEVVGQQSLGCIYFLKIYCCCIYCVCRAMMKCSSHFWLSVSCCSCSSLAMPEAVDSLKDWFTAGLGDVVLSAGLFPLRM